MVLKATELKPCKEAEADVTTGRSNLHKQSETTTSTGAETGNGMVDYYRSEMHIEQVLQTIVHYFEQVFTIE